MMCKIQSLNDIKKHPTVNISKPGLPWSQLAQCIRITDSDLIKSVSNFPSQYVWTCFDQFIVAYFVPNPTMQIKCLIENIKRSLKTLAYLKTCLSLMVKVYIHNRFENLSCIFQVAFETGATWTLLTVTSLLWLQESHHLLVKANISSYHKGLNWRTLEGFFCKSH